MLFSIQALQIACSLKIKVCGAFRVKFESRIFYVYILMSLETSRQSLEGVLKVLLSVSKRSRSPLKRGTLSPVPPFKGAKGITQCLKTQPITFKTSS